MPTSGRVWSNGRKGTPDVQVMMVRQSHAHLHIEYTLGLAALVSSFFFSLVDFLGLDDQEYLMFDQDHFRVYDHDRSVNYPTLPHFFVRVRS